MSTSNFEISEIFSNATYFGVILQFVSTYEIFKSVISINKFINKFIKNKNNEKILKRMILNEFYEPFMNNSLIFTRYKSNKKKINDKNSILDKIKRIYLTKKEYKIIDTINHLPKNSFIFEYLITKISKLKNIPISQLAICYFINKNGKTFVSKTKFISISDKNKLSNNSNCVIWEVIKSVLDKFAKIVKQKKNLIVNSKDKRQILSSLIQFIEWHFKQTMNESQIPSNITNYTTNARLLGIYSMGMFVKFAKYSDKNKDEFIPYLVNEIYQMIFIKIEIQTIPILMNKFMDGRCSSMKVIARGMNNENDIEKAMRYCSKYIVKNEKLIEIAKDFNISDVFTRRASIYLKGRKNENYLIKLFSKFGVIPFFD